MTATTTADQAIKSIEQVLSEHRVLIDRTLEKWLPRKLDEKSMEFLCGPARYAYDAQSATGALCDPTWEILDRGGKRWRPTLLILVAEALGKKAEDVLDFVAICEMVHNGSLVVDDIEDKSELRRGKPCIHIMFPADVAINAGNGMYFLPLVVLRELRGKVPESVLVRCYEIYSQEMINLHFGQGLDIWWHNGKKDPNVPEYLQMCAYKTGTLARLSAKMSALISGGTDDQISAFGRFAESIGVAFQIQDDILNLVGEKFGDLKGVGEDIHEGKRTLMVIHCQTNAAPAVAKRLNDILMQHTSDQTLINEAIDILKTSGSLEFARQEAKKIISGAWAEISPQLPDSEAKNKLKAFADYLVERDI